MMFIFARDCALEVSYKTLGDALLGSCEAESTHTYTYAHSSIYVHAYTQKAISGTLCVFLGSKGPSARIYRGFLWVSRCWSHIDLCRP